MNQLLKKKEIIFDNSTIEDFDIIKYYKNNNVLFATQINCLRKNNSDKKLEELISELQKYKKEEKDMRAFNKVIPHYEFRKTFFKNIELILLEIGEIENREKREESINKLYKWYKNKMNYYFTLHKINKKSFIQKHEQIQSLKYKKLNNKQNKDSYENDIKHRTKITI